MTFLSLLFALLLEQAWPLRPDNPVYGGFGRLAERVEGRFSTGGYRDGVLGWALVMVPVLAATVAGSVLLQSFGALAVLLWNVGVLYLTMGFRRFSHFFTEIQEAMRAGEPGRAREFLARWRGESAAELGEREIVRLAIEEGLLASHRSVFGTMAWFVVLGPAGAMLYRGAALLAEKWGGASDPERGEFGRFAERLFGWLDWVPVRLTAASFAVVGNFEDAVFCWRTQALSWASHAQGILLASGGGALGVRLGDALHQDGGLRPRPELGVGDEPEVEHMQSAAGLVWRALVVWMFLVLIVSIAHALG
ncbi:MAG: CobD/CbiB family protein [Dehalococcoidia bacterium]|nr:CobD/CbiB family protein [Dehalococcoidia bacterium]